MSIYLFTPEGSISCQENHLHTQLLPLVLVYNSQIYYTTHPHYDQPYKVLYTTADLGTSKVHMSGSISEKIVVMVLFCLTAS